jgi:glycosyltransferase involved in cell wall biosynthesis
MSKSILFFADRLPPLTGGMEMHGRYFIEHFTYHPQFPLAGVVTKNSDEINYPDVDFLFFNSGRWIEELTHLRTIFPKAAFLYRTGGNEILKAPLTHQHIPDHSMRQALWAKNINQTIDIMITNSAYTEKRLSEIGITCPFKRSVGGVNTAAVSRLNLKAARTGVTIFCAARFVPYKNHALLISLIKQLVMRGHKLHVRFAGDGPLLEQAKEQVVKENLSSVVKFLGLIDNEEVCRETANATLYMQLSEDRVTQVPGGSYIHSEGMGRSILEALTAGTFVVAGRSGALAEIVTPDRGLLVDLDDLEQIIHKVEPLIKDPPKRRPFTNRYSWRKVFQFYEELFKEL